MTLTSRMYTPTPIPLLAQEEAFVGIPWIEFTRSHLEIPIFAVCAYLAFIFWVPERLKNRKPFGLKVPFALWSLSLAVYSFFGTIRVVPHLLKSLWVEGFKFSVCTDPHEWYLDGPSGFWVGLFIYSKIPELIDTVFLVLQKKNIIFLHWFHHVTVLLYCWHSYHQMVAPGIWFVAMNYSVHTIMYAYYFFTGVGMKGAAKKLAPYITSLQLAQMIIGATVTGSAAYYYNTDSCATDPANYKLGLAMYVAYAILFGILFRDLYCSGKPRGQRPPAKGDEKDTMCGVEIKQGNKVEGGGLFHPASPTTKDGKKAA